MPLQNTCSSILLLLRMSSRAGLRRVCEERLTNQSDQGRPSGPLFDEAIAARLDAALPRLRVAMDGEEEDERRIGASLQRASDCVPILQGQFDVQNDYIGSQFCGALHGFDPIARLA